MKKIVAISVAVLLALPLVAGTAQAGKKKKAKEPIQTEEGFIAFPAPWTDDSGCYAGLHRRGAIMAQGNNNGVTGYHFDVDKKTWKKPFKLEVAGTAMGDADLDIYFYLADFGTPEVVVSDPGGAGAPPTISFNTREPGGESDKVPPQAQRVIICQYGGAQGTSFGADFIYTAG